MKIKNIFTILMTIWGSFDPAALIGTLVFLWSLSLAAYILQRWGSPELNCRLEQALSVSPERINDTADC